MGFTQRHACRTRRGGAALCGKNGRRRQVHGDPKKEGLRRRPKMAPRSVRTIRGLTFGSARSGLDLAIEVLELLIPLVVCSRSFIAGRPHVNVEHQPTPVTLGCGARIFGYSRGGPRSRARRHAASAVLMPARVYRKRSRRFASWRKRSGRCRRDHGTGRRATLLARWSGLHQCGNDVRRGQVGHFSHGGAPERAPSCPAALMAAEVTRCSGREFLTGVVAGYEVMERLAADFVPTILARGFHAGAVVQHFRRRVGRRQDHGARCGPGSRRARPMCQSGCGQFSKAGAAAAAPCAKVRPCAMRCWPSAWRARHSGRRHGVRRRGRLLFRLCRQPGGPSDPQLHGRAQRRLRRHYRETRREWLFLETLYRIIRRAATTSPMST